MAETYLLNKLKSVEQTFNELNRRLADPDNRSCGVSTSSEVSLFTEEVVNTYEAWKTTQEELGGSSSA